MIVLTTKLGMTLFFAYTATPAAAQIDTSAIVQGQLTRSMMDGHAERSGRTSRTGPSPAEIRQTCTVDISVYIKRHGQGDSRVQRLKPMCRRAGY